MKREYIRLTIGIWTNYSVLDVSLWILLGPRLPLGFGGLANFCLIKSLRGWSWSCKNSSFSSLGSEVSIWETKLHVRNWWFVNRRRGGGVHYLVQRSPPEILTNPRDKWSLVQPRYSKKVELIITTKARVYKVIRPWRQEKKDKDF